MKNLGQFKEESLHEFSESYLDFARCQRPDGSIYGTSGQCRKGKEVGEDAGKVNVDKGIKALERASAKDDGDKALTAAMDSDKIPGEAKAIYSAKYGTLEGAVLDSKGDSADEVTSAVGKMLEDDFGAKIEKMRPNSGDEDTASGWVHLGGRVLKFEAEKDGEDWVIDSIDEE